MGANSKKRHTGFTSRGSTKDVRVDRIGRVSIYQRGKSYWLYYRERGQTVRK